jgi:hypothetical protein
VPEQHTLQFQATLIAESLMRVLHPRSPADWRDAATMGTVAGGTDVADDVEIAIQ